MTSTTAEHTHEERAVRAVIDEVYAAWAAGDADAFVAPYAEDATAQLPGTYLPNREAIRATMAAAFEGPLKGTSAVHEVQSVRFLGPAAAVVISKGAVVPAGATEPDGRTRSLETWVLSRRSGAWRVAAFHNCPEEASAAAADDAWSLAAHYRRSKAILPSGASLSEIRDVNERWGDVSTEPGGVDYIEVDAGGTPAMWIVPKESAQDRVILCLHGGGFVGGSIYTHRKLFGHLAKKAGVRALSIDYGLTPEHRHPTQVDQATAAYTWLLDQGVEARHIALTGDSAGGGLVLSTMLRARERGLPLAAALMPFSAWFDLELKGKSMVTNRGTDILFGGDEPLDIPGLVEMFLGPAGDPKDPLVNALYADLSGFPPIYLQVSSDEMLLDDSRALAEHARAADVEVELDEFPGQQHTFHMAVGRAPEADDAVAMMAAWVRPRLGL